MSRSQRTIPSTPTVALRRIPNVPAEIVYPESDGKPVAESELHFLEILRLVILLQEWYRDQPLVHVSGNQFLYWERGDPRKAIAPDVYVAKGVPKTPPLATYQVWREGGPPAVVIEVTSRKTRREDEGKKRTIYALIGVREYVQYDPLGEWLQPGVRGYRLGAAGYEPLPEAAAGGLWSEELGLRLVLEGGRLQLVDPRSGARLLSPGERAQMEAERAQMEAERAQMEAERAQMEAERANAEASARRAAEARAAAAEARLLELEARLRDQPPSTR